MVTTKLRENFSFFQKFRLVACASRSKEKKRKKKNFSFWQNGQKLEEKRGNLDTSMGKLKQKL